MSNIKELFSSPKRAAALVCTGVILAMLGICVVVYAAGGPGQSSAIGGENAQNYAFADAGVDPVEAKAVKTTYERFQGEFVYEVEFTAGDTEYEYKIHAEDGSVVKKESKTVKGSEAGAPLPDAVTLEEARDAALADAGLTREQAVFTEAERDEEDRIPVYEFKFYAENVEYTYEINAQTGAVYSKGTTVYVERESGTPPAPAQDFAPAHSAAPAQTSQQPAQDAAQQPAVSAAPSTPAPAVQSQPPADQAYIGADTAKSAALADAGVDASQATFTKARLDREDGIAVYDVEFYTATHEYEYEINAATGAVYRKSMEAFPESGGHHSDQHHDDPHHSTASTADFIGMDAAKSAALSHAGCSADEVTFTKGELDYDGGKAVYEIEFRKGRAEYEYEIDAVSGTVLKYDWDQD